MEVLGQIIETIRAQGRYQRKLQAMTAEARVSAVILALLPPAFVAMILLFSPGYLAKLFTPGVGLIISMIAVTMYMSGILWVRKLMNSALG